MGRVVGVEVVARDEMHSKFTGWLAYTLSRSQRRDSGQTDYRLFQYDQTHILPAVGMLSLPRNWQLSSRFRLVKSLGVYQSSGFSLRIGQMLTRAIGVGLAIDYAGVKKAADSGGLGNLAMEVSLNPWRNLSVHGGASFGFVMVTDQNSQEKSLRGGAGTCLLAGVSYDFFPWRNRAQEHA